MPPNDDADEYSSIYLSSDDEEVHSDNQHSNNEDEGIEYENKDALSQEMMETFTVMIFSCQVALVHSLWCCR